MSIVAISGLAALAALAGLWACSGKTMLPRGEAQSSPQVMLQPANPEQAAPQQASPAHAATSAASANLDRSARTRAAGEPARESLERHAFVRMAMGGEARITLYAPDRETARTAAIAAFDEIERVEQALSDWRANSEVRLVERAFVEAPGTPVEISETLADAIRRSQQVAAASDGAFDPTIAPLVALWREAQTSGARPAAEALAEARERVGWDRVEVRQGSPPTATAPPGTRFDFGGIGKGFGADRALAVLRTRGLVHAMVELGGDFAIGAAPPDEADEADKPELRDEPAARGASGWAIAIATGLGDERLVLTLADCGVATSGDLERFVEIDGVHYSHILDPTTGLGLTTPIAVTVIASDAALADALASATSVLGAERAASVLAEFDAAARVVTAAPGMGASETPRVESIGAWPE